MDKIQVMVEVPSISAQYEMLIPEDLLIRDVLKLAVNAVKEVSGGLYAASGTEILCARGQDILLDDNRRLKDFGIGNGDHLLLI